MIVCTTRTGSQLGLACIAFEEFSGWQSAVSTQSAGFTPGVQLQGVSPYRDRFDIFGLESDGGVDWLAVSTQFQGLTVAPNDCTTTVDTCAPFGTQVQ
jgi:hypothetical protein